MKLCDYCETNLPDDAKHCAECGMVLLEAANGSSNGTSHIPNPVTPIPDVAVMETIPALHDEALVNTIPSIEDGLSQEPTSKVTKKRPRKKAKKHIQVEPVQASTIIDRITDDSPPTLVIAPAIPEPDAETITDDPPPEQHNRMPSTPDLISDDISGSDETRPYDTDPNLAEIPSQTLVSDLDDDPTPANGHLVEQQEDIDTLPVMSFAETDEEVTLRYSQAQPAPLYPDYGKAVGETPAPLYTDEEITGAREGAENRENIATIPTPLYADYEAASSEKARASTHPLLFVPRKISTAYPRLLSGRGLVAIAFCLLLILGSIGIFIFRKSPPVTRPTIHTNIAKLDVLKTSLSSPVVKGHKVYLAAEISNSGGQPLHWTANTGETSWLSIDKSGGIIPVGAPIQMIYIKADATSLVVGNYTGALQLHSNGGNTSVSISLKVIPSTGRNQPILTVDQTSLAFGTLQQGQQVTKTVIIGNAGTGSLNWQASSTSSGWVTLTPASGSILAGGYPQTLAVTVNTAILSPGASFAQLNINSNVPHSKATVLGISLNVIASNGNALSISASPGSFTNGCLNCTVYLTASQGGKGSQPSVHWSTSGVGVSGIIFNPSAGTLLAGQSIPVMVSIPNTICPASANFTFAGAANTVSVFWSCTPPPMPYAMVTVSPTSLTNCYTCTVYISPAAGSQNSLKWTSSSSGINGIRINPPSGTIAAGNSQAVTVTVPNTNCPTNANSATLTFNGQGPGNSAPVVWNCIAPQLQAPQLFVNPTTLNQSQCTNNNDGTYTCTVTLSESPAGNLNWSTYTNVGGTFSQSFGQFSSGQTQATIIISNILCQNGSFGFNGMNNSAPVQWTCASQQTPTLTVTPPTLIQNSSVCPSDGNGGYTCTVTLSENPQGTLNWQERDNLGIAVSQSTGTLTPGNSSIQVSLFSIPCSSQGTYDTFTFSATGSNTVTANWSCTAPPTVTTPPTTVVPTIPAAPSNISATATSSSSIQVTWSDNSNNETGFSIYNGGTSVTVGANTTSYTWGGLASGTYMCFTVSAYNTAGSSASTPYACATTPSVPSAPSNVTATATSSSTIVVTWNDNSNNESGFIISNGVTSVAVAANTTSYTWGGLAPGSYMCVSVSAYNAVGSSSWTPYACATTPSVPAAPSNVTATATSSSTIVVTWNDNSNNETGFSIYNGGTTATVGANTTSYTWGGLAPGTYMCFTIRAYNTAGSSAWTPYACATTPSVPAAPSNVSATATSSSSIQVTWSDNSNNETGFTISNGVTSVTVGANTTSYTWGGLASGTYMCFTISAYNAVGSSAWTPYACTTTPSIPAAPSNVMATATSSSSIVVTWSDNSNNESGFIISNGVTSVAVAANTTSYTWGGLASGTYMCFSIRAYNAAGSSAWTAYACTTTP